jgi:hypothetical protein
MLRVHRIVTLVLAGALALTGACGGKSAADEQRGNSGASAGSGGSSIDMAGTAGQGGEPAPGSGGSMGRAGSPGSAGTGPTPTGACSGPAEDGAPSCTAAFPNWTHDEKTGVCLPIIYGGCGATQNNYSSLAECQTACPARAPDYDACEQASDCMVMPSRCCGCFGQTFTAHDLIAFNRAHLAELDTCGGGRDVACTPCPDEPNGARRYFVPACVAGQCAVEDLRESELTTCAVDADCKLRLGSECCPACGENANLIAVRNDGGFEARVCGDTPPGCPECQGSIPESAMAFCSAGHCNVVYQLAR